MDFKPGTGIAASAQFPGPKGAPAIQTDIFIVDQAGRLNVFWADGTGGWTGPGEIGPPYNFVPGTVPSAAFLDGDDKTALFLVDKHGQLNMFWVEGLGDWQGPALIGPPAHFAPGAATAASPQFGTGQLDVFAVDKSGRLVVFWGAVPRGWNGPLALSGAMFTHSQVPSVSRRFGGTANRTDVFLVDDLGDLNYFSVVESGKWSGPQLLNTNQRFDYTHPPAVVERSGTSETMVFLVDIFGELVAFTADASGNWSGPTSLSDLHAFGRGAGVTASRQFGVGAQTDIFVVDQRGQLNVFWIGASGGWNGPAKVGPVGLLTPGSFLVTSAQFGASGRTDVFAVSAAGAVIVFHVDGSGPWQWNAIPISQVGLPAKGLSSNSNYIISNHCTNFSQLACDIAVTKDIAYSSDSDGSIPGFSFQLNCNSPKSVQNAYVQYNINFENGALSGLIDWWAGSGSKTLGWSQNICSFPSKIIPAGTKLHILLTTDTNQNVVSAQFSASDANDKSLGLAQVVLNTVAPVPPFTTTIPSPILACTMNIVAPGNSEGVKLSSGAGTITYSQDGGPVSATSGTPSCAQNVSNTLETSNADYGTLPPLSQNSLVQTFSIG